MIIQCHGLRNTIETRVITADGKPTDNNGTKYLQLNCHDSISNRLIHLNKVQLAVLIRELESCLEKM